MEENMYQAELVLKAESLIGEGSLWDIERSRLLWIDIWKGEVHSFDPASGIDTLIFKSNQTLGTVVQREGGGLVAAMEHGFTFINEQTGEATPILDPEPDKLCNRFNDGKCDPAGRFWAGTMSMEGKEPGVGSLYRLGTDLTCTKMAGDISISNGIIWSQDAKTMYYTDSPTQLVWAYDYDAASGDISNRRVVIELPQGEGVPDGITLDAEGMLWVAQWGGWQVSRYDPATGKKIAQVDLPVSQPSSCALGGPNLDELYITTARNGLTAEELAAQPLSGSLFVVKAGVKGLKAEKFKG
jgi:sugar lactone lactonase YvrE